MLFVSFLAHIIGGMEGEGRELLLQTGNGQAALGDLILEYPGLASQMKQIPLELHSLLILYLLALG